MSADKTAVIDQCAEQVGGMVARLFAPLSSLADTVAEELGAVRGRGRRPATSDLAFLRPMVLARLRQRTGPLHGAGVVFAPDALADARLHLEWWQRDGEETAALRVDLDPRSDRFYDYTALRWFSVPRDEGHRTACGPYVDLHGAESYIVTFTLPLVVDGVFFGVVGGDAPVSGLARLLVPPLLRLDGDAALTNSEGRVLATTTAALPVGTLAHRSIGADAVMEQASVLVGRTHWHVVRRAGGPAEGRERHRRSA
ncbi:hypothetical protein [Streptomyces uncialis]|uniref:PDC sensor domain-containing protein n=1 Tax=Streptomyces uncialis TaxID=1048205 RepID=UPI00386F388A|nr:hypothetical protein OG268_35405 [Streptomyces uncialis]